MYLIIMTSMILTYLIKVTLIMEDQTMKGPWHGVLIKILKLMLGYSFLSTLEKTSHHADGTLLMTAFLDSGEYLSRLTGKSVIHQRHFSTPKLPFSLQLSLPKLLITLCQKQGLSHCHNRDWSITCRSMASYLSSVLPF